MVGGGIVGSSAAYHLGAAGERVVLVDRADPGHATAAGAGIVAPGLSTKLSPAWEPLAFAAVGYYPQLLEELGGSVPAAVEYRTVGAIHLARSDAERPRLQDAYALFAERRAAGVANIGELSIVEGDALRSLCPVVNDAYAGVLATGAARVDGRSLRDALLLAFEAAGGKRLDGSASVIVSGSRVAGVDVGGERLDADVVILATGAWPDAVAGPTGADFGIAPQRGQILHLHHRDGETSRWPILYGFDDHYLLGFPGRRVVVGATREHGSGFDRRVTAEGQHELLGQALSFAPGLARATVVETRVGFRPVTADGLPLVGPVPGRDGLFLVTGLGPLGLTLGPYVGSLIAASVLERPTPLDLSAFAPGRLA